MRPARPASAIAAACIAALSAAGASAQEDAPAGTEADVAYAALLWDVMEASDLAGDGAIQAFPYPGGAPHGAVLQTFYTTGTVEDRSGALVIKRNYGPEEVTADEVLTAPGDHLAAVTVMFRREDGYDPENGDWFYAKYLPDGTLDQSPAGAPLAGRVGKGADAGCIPCHAGAGGGDFLFTTDADLPDR
jgi:hypothetical protein